MPQFDIHYFYSQAFWLALIFGALYLIAAKYIIPKANQISSHRAEVIGHNLNEAKDIEIKIADLNRIYEDEISTIKMAQKAIAVEYTTKFNALFDKKQQDLANFIDEESKKSIEKIANEAIEFYQNQDKATLSLTSFIIDKVTGIEADEILLKQTYQQNN